MGLDLKNVMTSLVLFSILVSLILGINNHIYSEYDITSNYVDDEGYTIIEGLNNINVISGLENFKIAVKSIYDGRDSTGSEFDILGALSAGALGSIKIGTGLVTAPIEILGVITGFYTIPSEIGVGLGLIIFIYIGYMVIEGILGK